MAAKTGNTYIYGTMTDRIEIPTANLGFLTTPSSLKMCQQFWQWPTPKNKIRPTTATCQLWR